MLARRAQAEELMDAADLDPAIYAQVLNDLAQVNTITLARRPTLRFLDRLVARGATRLTILDVGFGDGDMLRRIALWGQKRCVELTLKGIDINPHSAIVAAAQTPPAMEIEWQTGDYQELGGRSFDAIISSLVAHHMSEVQLIAFLKFMAVEAKRGWLINDLHRHGLAWLGFPLLARIMRWHPIVRHDGTLSVARAFRPAEWVPILAAAGVDDARIFRAFPFRLCVEAVR